jgi:hypothetical protein
MMEGLRQWLQDWSDACEYANECVPDLSFLRPHEPFTALAAIGLVCFGIWLWNELSIGNTRIRTGSVLNEGSTDNELGTPKSEEKLEQLRQLIAQSKQLSETKLDEVA